MWVKTHRHEHCLVLLSLFGAVGGSALVLLSEEFETIPTFLLGLGFEEC